MTISNTEGGGLAAPVRVQLRRTKGWRMPENTVKVDRTTKWGNPFPIYPGQPAAEAVRKFQAICERPGAYFEGRMDPTKTDQMITMGRVVGSIGELRGKNLACWCRTGEPCHADVLLELANAPQASERTKIPSKGGGLGNG